MQTNSRRAVISDIHGNLEALTAVLDDVRDQRIDDLICLGDIVGYGPNPAECLDTIRGLCRCVLGNVDAAVLLAQTELEHRGAAEPRPVGRTIDWTRRQLFDGEQSAARREFLDELARSARLGPWLFVHASPRNPLHEYVMPSDVEPGRHMDQLFALVEHYACFGHTHLPGVITTRYEYIVPGACQYQYPLGDGKLMVNAGSVGQPRDGDPRATYVILESDHVRFRRVAYEWQTTVAKIRSIPDLADGRSEGWLSGA